MPIDYNLYPKDWDARSRFIRFYRAKNKCEWCGVENGSIGARSPVNGRWYTQRDIDGMKSDCGWNLWPDGYPKTIRIVLTVAHVYDMDKMNASLLNLAALCQRCHLSHDRDHHRENYRKNREAKMGLQRLFE